MIGMNVEAWEVLEADGGNIRENHLVYFKHKEDAITVKDRSSSYRTVRPTTVTVTIFESVREFDDSVIEDKRQRALSKLTDEEIKILGLKK